MTNRVLRVDGRCSAMRKASPWLKRGKGWINGNWVDDTGYSWAWVSCLEEHFTIPRGTKEIRFVKGKTPESLRLRFYRFGEYLVTGHRNKNRDGNLELLSEFEDWFGKPKHGAWHYVECRS